MTQTRRSNLAWLLLSVAVIALDQSSKLWLLQTLPLYGRIELLPFLAVAHAHNTGVAFSMLNHAPAFTFVLLNAVVSLGILYWLWRTSGQTLVASALALILGGAVGNAIDRARLHYVVDFIDFHIGQWHFATFNVADSAICIGAGLLLLDAFLRRG